LYNEDASVSKAKNKNCSTLSLSIPAFSKASFKIPFSKSPHIAGIITIYIKYNDDTKINTNAFKINLKNDNLIKSTNAKFTNKKQILKNESDKSKQINNNNIFNT